MVEMYAISHPLVAGIACILIQEIFPAGANIAWVFLHNTVIVKYMDGIPLISGVYNSS